MEVFMSRMKRTGAALLLAVTLGMSAPTKAMNESDMLWLKIGSGLAIPFLVATGSYVCYRAYKEGKAIIGPLSRCLACAVVGACSFGCAFNVARGLVTSCQR